MVRDWREIACCFYCGAPDDGPRAAVAQTHQGRSDVRRAENIFPPAAVATRARSGRAYATGFAGLAYLFHLPLKAFAVHHLGLRGLETALLSSTLGLTAPVALVLAFVAAAYLDRSPHVSGRLPAMLGFLIGIYGTIWWLADVFHIAGVLGF